MMPMGDDRDRAEMQAHCDQFRALMRRDVERTSTRAEWCRSQAAECTALAAAVKGRDIKLELRRLARGWLDLAELAKSLDKFDS
jgi:hypothetical protein